MARQPTALQVVRSAFRGVARKVPEIPAGDLFLAWLWAMGYKVVPLDGTEEKRARSTRWKRKSSS